MRQHREDKGPWDRLTERERQIVVALALTGASTRALAEMLHVSAGTVRTHVANVLTKLGMHSKGELISWTWREGHVSQSSEES